MMAYNAHANYMRFGASRNVHCPRYQFHIRCDQTRLSAMRRYLDHIQPLSTARYRHVSDGRTDRPTTASLCAVSTSVKTCLTLLTTIIDGQQGRNHWGFGGFGTPPQKKKNWTDYPNFLMKSVITVTEQTAIHETGYTIRMMFCTIT